MKIKDSVSPVGLDREWVLQDLYFIKRREMSPDFPICRTWLAFCKEGEYNMAPAVNASVLIRKLPLEQNQTHTGME